MNSSDIAFVKRCISDNDLHRFYIWRKWRRKRLEVLRLDRNECQRCLVRKIYTRATTVHHVKEVKKYPQYALEIYIKIKKKKIRNLISLCHGCHEEVHNNRIQIVAQLTEERWD